MTRKSKRESALLGPFLCSTAVIALPEIITAVEHKKGPSNALSRFDFRVIREIRALFFIQPHGLNYLSNDPEVETRKRITWAFFMLDRSYSASRNYSLSLSDKQIRALFFIQPHGLNRS
jgi:hypothetical protein